MATILADNEAFQRALAALQTGNVKDAELLFKAVLQARPRHVAALNLLGIVLTRLGKFAEAETYLRRALREQPGSDATLYNYGMVLKALNRPNEALERFTQALAINPSSAETWNARGIVFDDLKRFAEALADFEKVTELNPRYAHAWFACGNALRDLKRYDEALKAYDRALALEPNWPVAHANRGAVLVQLQRHSEAVASCDRAIALAPDLVLPHANRGGALFYLRRHMEALASSDRALSLDARYAEAWLVRANVLTELKQYDEALAVYDRAIGLKPDLAEAWLGRGNVYTELARYDDASVAYDRALALKPDLAEAWLGRGRIFSELKRRDDASAAYEKTLRLKPDLPEAWLGRGSVITELAQYDEAFAAYDRALALKPDLKYAGGGRLNAKLMLCNWTNLEPEMAQLLAETREGKPSSVPFTILAAPSSAADQLRCARRYVEDQLQFSPLWRGEVYSHDRIRVAYLSADFAEHAVAQMTIGLFEQHDRSRFEVTGVSFGPDQDSPMRQRIKGAFEHFVDVRDKSDQEIAELIRRLEIDIAVDLTGFTLNNRLNVFARRPAPIQVNYLGYPGTLGASYIDYILADPTIIPEDQCAFYDERVVWLPESYQVNDNRRAISADTPTRAECGLPDTGFVFCCFNNAYKITPAMFDIWMRLLQAVEGSVLWLRDNGAAATANLRREAERRGVAAERVIFAGRVALMADHLARYRQADLFLDTLPYNAHTTASDALSAGVPVLTCLGSTFAGRVAASVLRTIGLDDLVARSLADYEALALSLARNPAQLASVKERLARGAKTSALFDTERTTRQFEAAYTMMWQRHQNGQAPHDASTPIRIIDGP